MGKTKIFSDACQLFLIFINGYKYRSLVNGHKAWNFRGDKLAPVSGSVVSGEVPGTTEKLRCCNKVAM